ncbi:TPA: ABC transporter ATP-binding protein [Candidatus Poribacteria bacterium]|nr:ABC transporter ATP-binding protein [Candidatus Poribacteria bacterium]
MLEVRDLVAHYGDLQVLYGVNLDVDEGEIVAIIGENGSGKSTTLKCIFGLLKPTGGSIFFDGKNITRSDPAALIKANGRKKMAYVLQGRRIFRPMTVEENLELGGYTIKNKKLIKHRMEEVYQLFPPLKERRKAISGTLSGGELQMLAIGRGLMLNPDLLLLDEPSLGLSPQIVAQVADLIKKINSNGTSILLVEQNVSMALSIADRAYAYEIGESPREFTKEEISEIYGNLSKSEELRHIYLGSDK